MGGLKLQNHAAALLRFGCWFQRGNNSFIKHILQTWQIGKVTRIKTNVPQIRVCVSLSLPNTQSFLLTFLRQCTAFRILDCTKFTSQSLTSFVCNWSLLLSSKLLEHARIISQINLSAYNQARDTRAMMVNLWEPLLFHVFE